MINMKDKIKVDLEGTIEYATNHIGDKYPKKESWVMKR